VSTELTQLGQIWAALGGDPGLLDRVRISGPEHVLPGAFDVTRLATTAVAAATLAVAELGAERRAAEPAEVGVDRIAAAAAFRTDVLLRPIGWQLPQLWDPIAGNYQTSDGWIRLHTNYASHRAAALRALGFAPTDREVDREQVAERVWPCSADELELRVVAEGGCAAALHTVYDWAAHRHGMIANQQPAVTLTRAPAPAATGTAPGVVTGNAPLSGIRVLDLTRVMAGPTCTRTLAAWGAEVLRIDPPGFAEVPALLPDYTVGKHCAAMDLRTDQDRDRFAELVAEADVIVHGLRPGALAGLGFSDQVLRRHNPQLSIAAIDAYGWDGPWAGRRGFDSLVQFSCGIAAASGAAVGSDRPGALPAQALDHAIGYLSAAAVCRALTGREQGLGPADIHAALIGAANLLIRDSQLPAHRKPYTSVDFASLAERRETAWGPVAAIGQPGTIAGQTPGWQIAAGPLGRHAPAFER
jgi:CoA-transferase family III